MEIVLATANPAKVEWLTEALRPAGVGRIVAATTRLADETADTCEENALLKAASVARRPRRAVVAEDSGLFVDALDGFPGTHTARWAPGTDDDRARLLLDRLAGVPARERAAEFRSAVVVVLGETAAPVTCVGSLRGAIAEAPRGELSAGYDRIFELPSGVTIAEAGRGAVEPSDHRRQALRAAADAIARWAAGARQP